MLDWVTAAAAGFLESDGRQAWAAPDLPEAGSATSGEQETILSAWIQAAATLLNIGEEPCPGCLLALHELHTAGAPRTVEQLAAAMEVVPQAGEAQADEPEGTPCPDCGEIHDWERGRRGHRGTRGRDGGGAAGRSVRPSETRRCS